MHALDGLGEGSLGLWERDFMELSLRGEDAGRNGVPAIAVASLVLLH